MFHAPGNTVGRLYSCLYAALSLVSRRGLTASALRAACVAAMLAGPVGAADFTWFGGAFLRPTLWSSSGNWQNFAIPPTNGVNTDVFLKGAGGDSYADDEYHIDSLTFHSDATGSWTLMGGPLIVDSFIRNNDSNTHRIGLNVIPGDLSLTITAAAGDLDFVDTSFGDGTIHFAQNSSTVTFNGGRSVFFKNFSSPNFTREAFVTNAQVNIDEGTLVQINGTSSAVTRWNVLDGTLQMNKTPNQAMMPSLGADATVDLSAGGTFDLNGVSMTIGQLTGSGNVNVGNVGAPAILTVGQSSNFSFDGVISGTGGVNKGGSSTFTVSGINTYTGATQIAAGRLRLGVGGSIASSAIVLAPGATFDVNGNSTSINSLWSQGAGAGTVELSGGTLTVTGSSPAFSGNVQGPGILVNTGPLLALTGTNNTFSTLQIDDGTLSVDNAGALGSGNIIIGNATLQTTATMTNSRPISLAGSSGIEVNSGTTLTQNGVISGSGGLNKLGGGTLVLGANNTYSGITTITAGTLRLGASNRISDVSDVVMSSGATFQLSNTGSETVASLSGGGTLDTRTSARLTVNAAAGTTTFAGTIIGGGGINKDGAHTLILTGSNTYTGATNVIAGTLRGNVGTSSLVTIGTGATWHMNSVNQAVGSIAGGGAINVQGATLTLTEDSSATRTFSGSISGTGGLTKNGTHTLVLSGNNSYLSTGINAGVLRVANSNNLGTGAIVFGGGTLNTTGSFTNSRLIVINSGATATFDVDAGTTLTQTGSISGAAGSLAKTGGGMLVLSGSNSFSGELYLQDGMLSVSASNHLGDASVPIIFFGGTLRTTASFENGRSATIGPFNSGTFYVAGPTTLTQSGPISGDSTATLIKNGGGVLRVTGSLDASFSGAVTIHDGAVELFHNAGASFGGDISGDGSLRKGGTGVYTLSGNLTYGGETRVAAGTLRRDGGSGLPNTTDLHVAAGAVYDLNNQSDTINTLTGEGSVTLGSVLTPKTLTIGSAGGSGTFSGAISGTLGHLAKTGAGTQVLTGNNTYAQTFFNGGVLSTVASANLGSGQLNFNGGTWQATGTFTNSRAISIGAASSATVDVVSGETLTQTGNITGILPTLNKIGAGTLVLSGSASLGTVNINAGVIRFSGGTGFANNTNVSVASDATWDLNGVGDTVATIAGTGEIQLNGGAQLNVGGNTGSTTFSGVLSGSGSLVKSGSNQLTLSGANTFSGGTAINGGVLAISSNANLGAAGAPLSFDGGTLRTSSTTTIGRNVTLNTNGGTIDTTANLVLSGTLNGTGPLIKTGGASLQLTGNSPAFTGAIHVSAGTLLANAEISSAPIAIATAATFGGIGTVEAVVSEGKVAPGHRSAAAGSLDVAGDFTQHAGGTLDIELAGTRSGDYDRLAILGNASLDGRLSVSLLDGFVPAAGDAFEIVGADRGITGTFADTIFPTLAGKLAWSIDYGANSVTLAVATAALSGDFNGDGKVDAADYVLWRKNIGTPEAYDEWRGNFGASAVGSGATAFADFAAVPEPSTLILLGVGGLAMMMRRGGSRRRHRRLYD